MTHCISHPRYTPYNCKRYQGGRKRKRRSNGKTGDNTKDQRNTVGNNPQIGKIKTHFINRSNNNDREHRSTAMGRRPNYKIYRGGQRQSQAHESTNNSRTIEDISHESRGSGQESADSINAGNGSTSLTTKFATVSKRRLPGDSC